MSSHEIETLLQPPDVHLSREKALLFLNNSHVNLSAADALVALDALHTKALSARDDLKIQLSESQSKLDALISQTRSHVENLFRSVQETFSLQDSLKNQLSILSHELASSMSDAGKQPTLLEEIETLHRSLRDLEGIRDYVRVVQHALSLSEVAVQQIKDPILSSSITHASVSEYKNLQEFVSNLKLASSQAEEEQNSLHLLKFLENLREKTWANMKAVLTSSLLAAAEKLNWPMPVNYADASADDRESFEIAFGNLLELHKIGENFSIHQSERSERDGLYPIQALIQPLSQRFKYHFEGERETNRLDKPEWFFKHVLSVIHEHRNFMETIIQGLLMPTEYRKFDAWREFTLLLLPLLSRKLRRIVPSLLPHPPLLAHTIYECLAFDAALREDGFDLLGTSAGLDSSGKLLDKKDSWSGISDVILSNKEWFETWMEGERKFADDQYHEILSSSDAWLIADDEADDNVPADQDMKTTNCARRIKALVDQVTDRYSPLPHFTQRTRFFLAVQLPLLEKYHARISSSLDAFETLSSAILRAVPGALVIGLGGGASEGVRVDPSGLTNGVDGLQRLCKALVSAKFMVQAMENWGEDLFFLELWAEINRRSFFPDRKGLAGNQIPNETIFQELVVLYQNLVSRAENMIVQQACGEIEANLKAHFASLLSTDSAERQPDAIVLPQTLLGPISLLSAVLKLLRSTVPQVTLTMLYRRIASALSEHILHREILYRGAGRVQPADCQAIAAECELWVETCHAALAGVGGRDRIEAPWLALLEAGRLISLEGSARDKAHVTTFGPSAQDELEKTLLDLVGISVLGREKVGQILRVKGELG